MKRISPVLLTAAFAIGFGQAAWAGDDLDVTMRVLDDVTGIDAVLLSVDNGVESEHGDASQHDGEPADRSGHDADTTDHADQPDLQPHDFDAAGDLDLEDHSEQAIEDHDVPHPPPATDAPADGTPPADAPAVH
jgi:hypothetical protein